MCRCCKTLKEAATWGAAVQMGVGLLLLARFFIFEEILGDFRIPYLVYVSSLIPLAAVILLAVQKEVEWLLKGATCIFVILQIFGFIIRLLVPVESQNKTYLQRISALFLGIIVTCIYTTILIKYARKLAKTQPQSSAI